MHELIVNSLVNGAVGSAGAILAIFLFNWWRM